MKKKMTKVKPCQRIISSLLALTLLLSCSFSAAAEESTTSEITISTVEELINFSSDCSLDIWSQGKTFTLLCDLDLADTDFAPVPSFGGAFDGGGHTISNLNIGNAGSDEGFFRFIQEGGTVKNLKIAGRISPSGSKNNVGGIAGNNSGSIQNCSFSGMVSGESSVGGIAGVNQSSGTISSCSTVGVISGHQYTGGICGQNLGTVIATSNSCNVNVSSAERKFSTDDIDLDINSIIDQFTTPSNEEEPDSATGAPSDTGGIAGYSSGIIQNSSNGGTIGYQHMGYNVGGIAGRHAGFISGCTNTGEIYGRKDVGGICGQAEPYVVLQLSEDTLNQLQDELARLNEMISATIGDVGDSSSQLTSYLNDISGYANSAKDSTHSLFNQTADFIDDNVGEVNNIGATVSDSLRKIVPITDELKSASDSMITSLESIREAFDSFSDSTEEGSEALENLKGAADDLVSAGYSVSAAFGEIKTAVQHMQSAAEIRDETAMSAAIAELQQGNSDLRDAFSSARDAVDELKDAHDAIAGISSLAELFANIDATITGIIHLGEALWDAGTAAGNIIDALLTINVNFELDWSEIEASVQSVSNAMGDFQTAALQAAEAMKEIEQALSGAQAGSSELQKAFEKLSEASGGIAGAFDSLSGSFAQIKDLTQSLADEEPIKFTQLGEDYRTSANDLYSSVSGISSKLSAINGSLSDYNQEIMGDIQSINDQINVVTELMLSAMSSIGDTSESLDIENYIQDTSDEDINNTKLGKILSCGNSGTVQADRNVGGIAGTMGIEYSLDPENDLSSGSILNRTYETKAILQNCTNHGEIVTKKDCSGGTVGRMDIGTVIGDANYGKVTSSGGSYVGGIAGLSSATVRECYSKCILSGSDYIGGIAGSGEKIRNCSAIIEIDDGSEYIGAIAGYADVNSGKIENNVFIENEAGVAGIDGVSYAEIAQPTDMSGISAREGVPAEFMAFTLTFTADGSLLGTVNFNYGDDLSGISLPDIPEKDGCFGSWPEHDFSCMKFNVTLDAIYSPWITVLSSEESAESEVALALVEGEFTDTASVSATKSTLAPPDPENKENENQVLDIMIYGSTLSEESESRLHLLDESSGGDTSVFQFEKGVWKKVNYIKNGAYFIVDMHGTSGSFCIVHSPSMLLQIAIICGAAVLLLIIALKLIQRLKRHKKAKKAIDTAAK